MWKEEKGITLVALVLIIVVLLIIAGVALSVMVQNNDNLTPNPKVSTSNNSSNGTMYEDAKAKVQLIFELYEAKYQTELAKGNVIYRSQVFTAESIAETLEEYNIKGNTKSSLGPIDVIDGVTIKYGNEYVFLVRVSDNGIVTVIEK